MATTIKRTILIADAYSEFANSLEKTFIKDNYNVIGKVSSKVELYSLLLEITPDIVILDYNLSQESETDAALGLHRRFPGQKILLLAYFANLDMFEFCIDHNINGFMLKSSSAKELHEALETVINGGFYMPNGESDSKIDTPPELNTLARKLHLNLREMQVIKYTVDGKTIKQIADLLFRSENTINTYLEEIYLKTGIVKLSQLIPFATENLLK